MLSPPRARVHSWALGKKRKKFSVVTLGKAAGEGEGSTRCRKESIGTSTPPSVGERTAETATVTKQDPIGLPGTDPSHVLHLLLICRNTLASLVFPKFQRII